MCFVFWAHQWNQLHSHFQNMKKKKKKRNIKNTRNILNICTIAKYAIVSTISNVLNKILQCTIFKRKNGKRAIMLRFIWQKFQVPINCRPGNKYLKANALQLLIYASPSQLMNDTCIFPKNFKTHFFFQEKKRKNERKVTQISNYMNWWQFLGSFLFCITFLSTHFIYSLCCAVVNTLLKLYIKFDHGIDSNYLAVKFEELNSHIPLIKKLDFYSVIINSTWI